MNTAEIISKVTITLSLINSNKDFDFVGNGNRTEWSPIQSVIIRVIIIRVRFVYHEYDYRLNWTTRSPTIN